MYSTVVIVRIPMALFVGLALLSASPSARGADEMDRERTAITKAAQAFVEAFGKEDSAALASAWTEDGDYVDVDGRVLRGRKAIADDFARMFQDTQGLTLRIDVDSVRFPTPDTAVEDGVTTVFPPDGGLPVKTRYTNLLVKKNGKWLLSTVRESHYVAPNNSEHLQPIEWLIGEWVQDTKDPHAARVVFEWTGDRNFIIATRLVGVKDALLDNGHQRIGWDPASRHLRSWTFESDGGFAEGAWIPEGEKWVNRVSAVTRTGSLMTSTMVIARVDSDTITCELRDQVLDGRPMSNPPAITMKRVK